MQPEILALEKIASEKKLKNIVITNAYFDTLAGSQLVTLDLAEQFRNSGAESVTIVTDRISARLATLAAEKGAEVVELFSPRWETRIPTEIDLLWGHHWPILGAVLLCAAPRIRFLVLSSLSPFEPIEQLHFFNKACDLLVFNSLENFDRQEHAVASNVKNVIFPNSLPDYWFQLGNSVRDLKRVAVVSNHAPSELLEAAEILRERDYEVDIIGVQGEVRLVDAASIDAYDAIVTIGHTVQKAIARRRPVFVYDRFGGTGWLSTNDIDRSEFTNHSGRGEGRRIPPLQIVQTLIDEYPFAVEQIDALRGEAIHRYSLSSNLLRSLEQLPDRDLRSIDLSSPDFRLERTVTQSFWLGRTKNTQINLSPLDNIQSLRRLAIKMNCQIFYQKAFRYIDVCFDGKLVKSVELRALEIVDSVTITGNLVFDDGGRPTKIMFVRDDGVVFRCRANQSSSWIGPRVGFQKGHDHALFVTTIAFTETTEWFDIIADHPSYGQMKLGKLTVEVELEAS